MDERQLDYLIQDQDGQTPHTLDLLQGWGPPLRPPLRARVARLLIRIANRLYPPLTDYKTTGLRDANHCIGVSE